MPAPLERPSKACRQGLREDGRDDRYCFNFFQIITSGTCTKEKVSTQKLRVSVAQIHSAASTQLFATDSHARGWIVWRGACTGVWRNDGFMAHRCSQALVFSPKKMLNKYYLRKTQNVVWMHRLPFIASCMKFQCAKSGWQAGIVSDKTPCCGTVAAL